MTDKQNLPGSPVPDLEGSQSGSNHQSGSDQSNPEPGTASGISQLNDEKNNKIESNLIDGICEKVTENDGYEKKFIATSVEELFSDGSASAFEGTESIDSHEQDMDIKRKEEQLKNDPSGRSNY